MSPPHAASIGQAAWKLTALAEEDLPLVLEFLEALEQRRTLPRAQLTVAQIRELAKARARLLDDVPRDVLMARFLELAEQIRQSTVAQGTAVEGDWTGD
jgi:hypothetical protein